MKARLWGLAVRGSGINQPELRSPWNQRVVNTGCQQMNMILLIFRFTINQRHWTSVFTGSHVTWSWVMQGEGIRAFWKISMLFPHRCITPWSSLVCRVLPERDVAPWPGLHLYHTWEPLAWTVYWIRGVLFALSMLSNSSGYSTQTQLHISTTQGALKTTRPIWSGLWGWPRWHQRVAGIRTTGKKCLLQTIYRVSPCTCEIIFV